MNKSSIGSSLNPVRVECCVRPDAKVMLISCQILNAFLFLTISYFNLLWPDSFGKNVQGIAWYFIPGYEIAEFQPIILQAKFCQALVPNISSLAYIHYWHDCVVISLAKEARMLTFKSKKDQKDRKDRKDRKAQSPRALDISSSGSDLEN